MSKLVVHLAYRGREKSVVYMADASGRMHGKDFYSRLGERDRAGFVALYRRLGDHGQIRNREKFRHEGEGIYAFKSGPHRLLCFFDGRDVVVTHGFKKQKRKLPPGEHARAKRLRSVYEEMDKSEAEVT